MILDDEYLDESRSYKVVENVKDSWQTPEVFYDLFKSKNPKICSRAANILYDWYSAEDAFSDFTSKKYFLNFVKSDLADMFDAADSAEEVRAVIEALIGLKLKDFVIQNLPEANKKITGHENPSATQIWDEADATLDDYSDYMIDKIIEITDCYDTVDYYIRSYIEQIIDAELPDDVIDSAANETTPKNKFMLQVLGEREPLRYYQELEEAERAFDQLANQGHDIVLTELPSGKTIKMQFDNPAYKR